MHHTVQHASGVQLLQATLCSACLSPQPPHVLVLQVGGITPAQHLQPHQRRGWPLTLTTTLCSTSMLQSNGLVHYQHTYHSLQSTIVGACHPVHVLLHQA